MEGMTSNGSISSSMLPPGSFRGAMKVRLDLLCGLRIQSLESVSIDFGLLRVRGVSDSA